jgi:hypothetical protein
MDKVQKINEKIMIIEIILGFALGIYLGVYHDIPNFWFLAVQWVFLISFIMTFISALGGYYANVRDSSVKFNITSIFGVFILNVAVISVSASFGFIFCSVWIGNFTTAN